MRDPSDRTATVPPASPVVVSSAGFDALFLSGVLDPPRSPAVFACLGRFDIVRQLGSGGMGIVLEGRDPDTGTRVAIKLLRPELTSSVAAVHRFVVETRHMRRLSHPHIVPVLDVCERAAGPYYVMPFMEGGSLGGMLGQPLGKAVVSGFARQIAAALVYAHGEGIIHRDIKPANILLAAGGHAFLGDFGLVRTFFDDSTTNVGFARYEGTAAYMSPAVAAGLKEDTRCDIYSFGAMLYEMLTGTPPYEGRSTEEVIRRVLAGPPQPIRARTPRAPVGLAQVAEGCMAREVRDRYAQMADVLADLERLERGKPISPPRGRRGDPARSLAVAAVLLLSVIMLAPLLGHLGRSRGVVPVDHPVRAVPPASPSVVTTILPLPTASPVAARLSATDQSITQLSLRDVGTTDADLVFIERFTKLQMLVLSDPGITDTGMVHLKGLTELRFLGLHGTAVTDKGLANLRGMTHLRTLDLWGSATVGDAALASISGLTSLETVCLRSTSVTDDGLIYLAPLTSLTWLDLRATQVSGSGLPSLRNLPRLHALSLSFTPLTSEGIRELKKFPALTRLDLSNTATGDDDAEVLLALPQLIELVLDRTNISDTGLLQITRLKKLEVLGLTQTQVTDSGLKLLSNLPRLKTLYLNDTHVTDAGLECLKRLPRLKTVYLSCPGVTGQGVLKLKSALPELSIRRNIPPDEDMED